VYFHHRGTAIALNIKDRETERLAAEVAAITGESKTRAVKVALQERRERLAVRAARRDHVADLRRFLEQEVWPQIPRTVLGRRVTRRERERILGYGSEGL
jgi:antitoxin VapB